MEFYLGFHDLMEEDLLRVVEDSKASGKVLGTINSTFIALIPRKDNLDSFKDFGPLSLCNFLYKIIAKIIANK
jgi:hypothetical protein